MGTSNIMIYSIVSIQICVKFNITRKSDVLLMRRIGHESERPWIYILELEMQNDVLSAGTRK
jgi:hypothetical protein